MTLESKTGGRMKIVHQEALAWVKEIAEMCNPEEILWIDGTEEEQKRLEEEALATGELITLDQKKWPGCLYHRTDPNDVARTEDLTFICTNLKEDAGPNNNWMSPLAAYRKAGEIFKGSMKGRTMYVIPFSMGPVGSPFSKIGIEITDSIYVVLNMRIMTIVGEEVMNELGSAGVFTKCLHGKADLNPKRRLILHFPEDNTIWSVGSGYGGNVLLGKKCLALRLASNMARKEDWLAEHMLIMGIEEPNGHITYIAAAFPSACGKTNLAMLIPPEGLKQKGYRIWTVGDDIAWMRVDTDGGLWAINPESGFFGVVPGTNLKTNPNAMATIRKNTIFTNVVLGENGDIWWEGCDWEAPQPAFDWRGRPWKPGMKDENSMTIVGAHPNSRFTSPIAQCPVASFRREHHHGVPISAIVFGGRRARLAPLVFEAFNWHHGVFMGAAMASERTSAQYGVQGEVRPDPMAMLPFCGYNMADYFEHWLRMGLRLRMKKQPKIFHVNWFRTDENGQFLWPGYGENLRVLEWILSRCRGEVDPIQTSIGNIPKIEDIDMTGLNVPQDNMKNLFKIDHDDWLEESKRIEVFFKQFGDRLPTEMWAQLEGLRRRLDVMKK
jgi:phosphoenolpyruvate carboxykinase (GTP)